MGEWVGREEVGVAEVGQFVSGGEDEGEERGEECRVDGAVGGGAEVGGPVGSGAESGIAEQPVRGERVAEEGEGRLEEGDEGDDERGGGVVRGQETLAGGLARGVEGEGGAGTGTEAEEVYVGVELVLDGRGEDAVGDEHDGVVGAEVGEGGEHEDAVGGVLRFGARLGSEETEGGGPGSVVVGLVHMETDCMGGIGGVHDEETEKGGPIYDPALDRVELVRANHRCRLSEPNTREGQIVLGHKQSSWHGI
jgi:hypothetical protein